MTTVISSRRVTVDDGVTLHADVEGAGPPVVILHGLGYAGWAAEPLRKRLRDRFAVWSLDTRGSGRSEKPTGPSSIQRFADDAAVLLAQVGPVHLVGYSMGGYVAQTVAHDHPALVRTLTLLSTSAGGPTAFDVPAETRTAWAEHRHLPPERFARATMPLSFSDGWAHTHPSEFEEFLDQRLEHPTPSHAWQAQFEACAAFLASGYDAAQVKLPVLVVHGDCDRVVPVHNGRDLARRVPGSRYHEIPGGHLIHLEQPDIVAVLFTDFVTDTSPTNHERTDHAHHRG